jgi:glycosyltransferase involved in cell wall biosynthesis
LGPWIALPAEDGIVKDGRDGTPLVSICCATYNHQKYLTQAIESFLMQRGSFPIEIVIGDDCSTDRTPQIVQDYAERFPQLVRVIAADANVGVSLNAFRIREAARGKYIALCEGDDYWTDPDKLQKQVDFLERNPEFTVSGHWVKNVDGSGNLLERQVFTGESCPEVFGVQQAIQGTPTHMNSWVFRTSALRSIPRQKMDLVLRLPAHDEPLLLLLLVQGKGFCFPETMGVWRHHSGGYWSPRSELNRRFAMLQFYYALPKLLNGEAGSMHRVAVENQIKQGEQRMAWAVVHSSGFLAAFKLRRMVKDSELMPGGRIRAVLGLAARQAASDAATYPRVLAGRALRSIGLR